MSAALSAIQVGTLAIAKRASGVSDAGERGVCYEVYTLGGRPGYAFIFENGYDGFSPEDVGLFLTVMGTVCPTIAGYQFTNVTRLRTDFEQGRFVEAFPPGPPDS